MTRSDHIKGAIALVTIAALATCCVLGVAYTVASYLERPCWQDCSPAYCARDLRCVGAGVRR